MAVSTVLRCRPVRSWWQSLLNWWGSQVVPTVVTAVSQGGKQFLDGVDGAYVAAVDVVDRSQRSSVGHDRIERKPLLGDDASHDQPEDIGNREAERIQDNGGFILGA